MIPKQEFKDDLEKFNRSWDYIKNNVIWLHDHYTDPRNRGNEGRIQTRTDIILIDSHLKEMQAICDKWKKDFP